MVVVVVVAIVYIFAAHATQKDAIFKPLSLHVTINIILLHFVVVSASVSLLQFFFFALWLNASLLSCEELYR